MFESSQRGGSLDYSDFHEPTLDALFARAREVRTDAQSREAWHAVQQELVREVPVVWLYHSRGVQGVSSRMRNVTMDLRGELVSVARWTTDASTAKAAVARR